VLEHPARSKIMQAIEAEPGVHFLALSRRLAIGNGTLDHHLRKLEQANLVRRHSSPGYVCFFPAGTGWAAMQAAPALRSDGGRAVAKALAEQPGATSREIAAKLGLAPSTVAYHLKRLQGAGVVTTGRTGSRLSGQDPAAAASA
jgi:predicted transcriptional regulator